MDIKKQLQLLAGNSDDNDNDLAGIHIDQEEDDSPSITTSTNMDEEDDNDSSYQLDDLSIDFYLGNKRKKKKKKKNRLSIFDEIELDHKKKSLTEEIEANNARTFALLKQDAADEFDGFFDDENGIFSSDEDTEMRNNLVSMGRKYARENAASKETAEITKTFAESEKRLKKMYEEIESDKELVNRDLERMRVPGRVSKVYSDTLAAKTSLHNVQLSVVREINSMRKAAYEMKMKEEAKKAASAEGANDVSPNMLQSLFNGSRRDLLTGLGGYSTGESSGGSSGPSISDYIVDDEMSDDEIEAKYFSDANDRPETDGDKFYRYEDRGVEMVLTLDENGKPDGVYAQAADGEIIDDYPLPDISKFSFDFDKQSGTATDNLSRVYRLEGFTEE